MNAPHARRRSALEEFGRWEATHPFRRSAADVIADLGAVREWLPLEARTHPDDFERLGIRRMHRALAVLSEPL